MSEEAVFMDGGKQLKLCEIDLRDGNVVTVEPYAIYTSNKKRRNMMWYQVSRAGAQGENGWRHVDAATVKKVKILDRPYAIRKDYDPFDKMTLTMMHYSIPTIDGRQRAVDLAPSWDKSLANRPAG